MNRCCFTSFEVSSPAEVEAAAQKASQSRFRFRRKSKKASDVVTADAQSSLKKDITAMALTFLPAGLVGLVA